jgi:hypothetical protein
MLISYRLSLFTEAETVNRLVVANSLRQRILQRMFRDLDTKTSNYAQNPRNQRPTQGTEQRLQGISL